MGMAMPKLAVMGSGTLSVCVIAFGWMDCVTVVGSVAVDTVAVDTVAVDTGNREVVAMAATVGVAVLGMLVSVDSTVAVGASMISDGVRVIVAVGGKVGRAVGVMLVDASSVVSLAAATDSSSAVAAGVDDSVEVTRLRRMG